MNIWFMYDCHTFAKVGDGSSSREQMEARARELFAEDGCGSCLRGIPMGAKSLTATDSGSPMGATAFPTMP